MADKPAISIYILYIIYIYIIYYIYYIYTYLIYICIKENRITSKFETIYYLELLTIETMILLGRTKKDKD